MAYASIKHDVMKPCSRMSVTWIGIHGILKQSICRRSFTAHSNAAGDHIRISPQNAASTLPNSIFRISFPFSFTMRADICSNDAELSDVDHSVSVRRAYHAVHHEGAARLYLLLMTGHGEPHRFFARPGPAGPAADARRRARPAPASSPRQATPRWSPGNRERCTGPCSGRLGAAMSTTGASCMAMLMMIPFRCGHRIRSLIRRLCMMVMRRHIEDDAPCIPVPCPLHGNHESLRGRITVSTSGIMQWIG